MNKSESRLSGWLALASLIFLAAGGLVYLYGLEDPPPLPGAGLFKETVESDETDDARDRGRPQLEVPAIGVSSGVGSLAKKSDGTLEVPTNYQEAGLWTGGPRPGERGAAVITGHVDSATEGPAVFARLGELAAGDIVWYTGRNGKRVRFEVERSERFAKESFPTVRVYGGSDRPRLRLVTCTGNFDSSSGQYSDNLVVYARRA